MKISNVIKVATAVVAVAATGVAIYSKIKADEIKKDETIELEAKEAVVEKNEKITKVASCVAVGAGIGFAVATICGLADSDTDIGTLYNQHSAGTAKVFLEDNLDSWIPNLRKAGLSDSVLEAETIEDSCTACGDQITSIAHKYFADDEKMTEELIKDLDSVCANGMAYGARTAINWCDQAEGGFRDALEGSVM